MFGRRLFCRGILALAVMGVGCHASAAGLELRRLLPQHKQNQTPYWSGNPQRQPTGTPTRSVQHQARDAQGQSTGVPGPHRYPEYNQSSPWYGYGLGVPTFSWGSFGAKYRPSVNCYYSGYYNDYYQWGYRRGY